VTVKERSIKSRFDRKRTVKLFFRRPFFCGPPLLAFTFGLGTTSTSLRHPTLSTNVNLRNGHWCPTIAAVSKTRMYCSDGHCLLDIVCTWISFWTTWVKSWFYQKVFEGTLRRGIPIFCLLFEDKMLEFSI